LESNLRLERDHAFVLSESDLKKIWDFLEENFVKVSADVEFSDNIARKVSSLEQLLSFENSKNRSIKRIEFNSSDENRENRSTVTFENYEHRPIRVTASGMDDVVTRFGDSIEEFIDGLKPWYSRLCKLDFFYIVGAVVFIGLMLLRIMIPDAPSHKPVELSKAVEILSVIFGFIGAVWFAVWWLNRIRARCFPIASFAIGQGKERYRVMENIRWGVVVAFAVSFSASAVFGILG
jgi:hypothetical protein